MNAATGLESLIVFVMGTHHMYQAEQSVRLSAEERASLIRDNTRKLYMACTRAGQRLAITYVGELPDVLQQLHPRSTLTCSRIIGMSLAMSARSFHLKNHSLFATLRSLTGNPRGCVYTEPLWGIPFNLYAPYISIYMVALGVSDTRIGLIVSISWPSRWSSRCSAARSPISWDADARHCSLTLWVGASLR